METKHVMTAFAAATLMLSACSNEDSLNTGKEWDGRLYLSSQVATLTRAAAQGSYDLDTKIAENEKVWLYVDKSDASKYYTKELNATGSNGFTNTNGSDIDDLFFPAEESDKIILYAFHGNISYSGGTTTMPTEYPSTEFTHAVEANQTSTSTGAYAKSDLLYAKKELEKATAKTNPTVKLEFKHLLSKIEVVLVKGNGLSAIDIKKVEICGTKLNAKFTPNKSTEATAVSTTADGSATAIEINKEVTDEGNKATSPTLNEAIIVPQTVNAETEFIKVTLDGKGNGDGELVYKIPAGGVTFAKSTKYRYTITTNLTGLTVTSEVSGWTEGTGDDDGSATM